VTSYERVSSRQRLSARQAATARDQGLRRVRKLTFRIGVVAAAAGAVIGAKFAHFTAPSIHLPSGFNSSGSSSGGSTFSGSNSAGNSGISSSSGITPVSGGGMTTSGGS
jgi:hypothetical protein